MDDDSKGNLVIGGIVLGILVGIVLSFILKSAPMIGDCGTNVEINQIYLYVGLFATKLLFTCGCALCGLFASAILICVIELFIFTKKYIKSIVKRDPGAAMEYIHRKYNYRYFANSTVNVLSEPYIMLIAWLIAMTLYVVTLRMSPEICYISNKTRGEFLLGAGVAVTVLSLVISGCVYGLVSNFRSKIRQYIVKPLEECNDLDSTVCECNTQTLEPMFDNDIYTVNNNRVEFTDKNGTTRILIFNSYNWKWNCDEYYCVAYSSVEGTSRTDTYYGYTLRQVIKETIKLYKKHQTPQN